MNEMVTYTTTGIDILAIFSLGSLLYPQYDGKIVRFILDNEELLKQLAEAKLEESNGIEEVRARWESIVSGEFFEEENLRKALFG